MRTSIRLDGKLRISCGLVLLLAQLRSGEAQDRPSALDQALGELPLEDRPSPDLFSRSVGPVNLRLIDISADLLAAAGGSTERDEALEALQGGGHDPRKRGFTLQNLELSLLGAVDPYFSGELHLVYFIDPAEGESVFEVEEAFLTTSELPWGLAERGLALEAGHFFTEFGRHNPRHPHQWEWLDSPVVASRFFGPDGLRGLGFRLGWLSPLPWFSELHLGMQNANGETMASFLANDEFFEERPIAGRPFADREVRSLEEFLYLARWLNSWNLREDLTANLGASGLIGPNATGTQGQTFIYGLDLYLKWQPVENQRGWPFVAWQTEVIRRDYKADEFEDAANAIFLAGETLHDWGLYSQVLWGFLLNWAIGFRADYGRGSGESVLVFANREEDPFRNERQRYSPLIVWQPTHFSRLRLQYNYDVAEHLRADEAHSVWFGVEIGFGRHPGHIY